MADLEKEVKNFNPKDWENFDFSCLWQDEEISGFGRFMPYINLAIGIIILIILIVK